MYSKQLFIFTELQNTDYSVFRSRKMLKSRTGNILKVRDVYNDITLPLTFLTSFISERRARISHNLPLLFVKSETCKINRPLNSWKFDTPNVEFKQDLYWCHLMSVNECMGIK